MEEEEEVGKESHLRQDVAQLIECLPAMHTQHPGPHPPKLCEADMVISWDGCSCYWLQLLLPYYTLRDYCYLRKLSNELLCRCLEPSHCENIAIFLNQPTNSQGLDTHPLCTPPGSGICQRHFSQLQLVFVPTSQ